MTVAGAVSIYLIMTIGILFFDIIKYKRDWFDPLYSYLFFISLYIIPLGIRYIVDMPISGNVTYMFYDIRIDYIYSVVMMALANLIFYMAYISFSPRRYLNGLLIYLLKVEDGGRNSLIAAFMLFIIGLSLFLILIINNGGLSNFILLGYGVTEQLVKSPLLASSFPILFTSSFLIFSTAIRRRNFTLIFLAVMIFIVMIGLCAFLGRRAEMAVWGLCSIIYVCCLHKKIKFKFIFPVIIAGFFMLNFIGIIRSSNNESISAVIDRAENVIEKTGGGYYDWIYTLIDGQFVVPFETLPVLMFKQNEVNHLYGLSPLINLAQWIPRFIWENKPYGLSRWYYKKFYDANSPENEGRTFFIYSEGYLNFGILGVFIWAILYGLFWKCISYIIQFAILNKSFISAFIGSVYVANIIRLIASDSSPIYVTLVKESIMWYFFPLFILMLIRRIKI